MPDPTPSLTFHSASPILPVANLARSLDYYVRVLGFAVEWQDATGIAAVSRGPCTLMLCQGDQGHAGTWVWIGVRHPPSDYPWAREMQVADLDGNVLRMGSDPRVGTEPGEWLDMHGVRWTQDSFGSWQRAD